MLKVGAMDDNRHDVHTAGTTQGHRGHDSPAHGAHGHGHHGGGHGHDHGADGLGDLTELLDLDAEVLRGHLDAVTAAVRAHTADTPPRRIVDLGCGTGTGTFMLLERFPEASSTAVDTDPRMLERLTEKSRARGVADRVRAVQADLDGTWPDLGAADVVWASASLHHVADPARALDEITRVLRPGGVLVLLEMEGTPRYLPDDPGVGKPGLEDRCIAAMDALRAEHVPHYGDDWAALLDAAGYTTAAHRTFRIDLAGADLPASAGRYTHANLSRARTSFADALAPEDLAALDTLLDPAAPTGVLTRSDLHIRATRTMWLAVRP